MFEFIFAKCFDKVINHLFINKNIFENNNIGDNLFSYIIMLYIDMLGTRMKLRVFNQNYNFLIITIKNNNLYRFNVKIKLI